MSRAAATALAAAGWILLGAAALAGVALSAVAGVGLSPRGGAALGALVERELGNLLAPVFAGRLSVEAAEVRPGGDLAFRGVRIRDPDGHLVLEAPGARVRADLAGLLARRVVLLVDLDAPTLLLDGEAGGGLSVARAFAPLPPPRDAPEAKPAARWAVELRRVTVRGGEVHWRRADGSTGLRAAGLEVDGRVGLVGGGVEVAARGRAALVAPVEGPLAATVALTLRGGRLEVAAAEVSLGGTTARGLGRWEPRTGAFRAAISRLELAAGETRRLAPAATGAAVAASGYAESDGGIATAALEVRRAADGAEPGTGRAAVALRWMGARPALGLDVALSALDPSRLVARAPAGRLGLTARGAVEGRTLANATGHGTLEVSASRLAGVEVGPIALAARARGGAVVVERLRARLSGAEVTARGAWDPRGPVQGELTVEAWDLARLGRGVAALTGAALPPLAGQVRGRATLAGTGAAPHLSASVDAPLASAGGYRVEELTASLEASGARARRRLRVLARAARAEGGGVEARALELAASLGAGEATVSARAHLPSLGPDPFALEAAARIDPDRRAGEVRALEVRWPGARYVLAAPAAVRWAPLQVDRLALADGPRSIAVTGGLVAADALDVRLEVVRLDVGGLPGGLLPPGLAGEVSLDARVAGPVRAPEAAGHVAVTGGRLHGLDGLQVSGDVRWDGRGRLAATLEVLRDAGGALEVTADLPLPLAGARAEDPVGLTAEASGWPATSLRALGLVLPFTGTLGGRLAASGTAGAPRVAATIALQDGAVRELGPLAAEVGLEAAGGAVRLSGRALLAGAPVLAVDARAPLPAGDLVRHPAATLRALAYAPLDGTVEIPGLALASVAGRAGLPGSLSGTVKVRAVLGGTLAAPQGRVTATLSDGAWAGYRELAARIELTAERQRTALAAHGTIGGAEALQLDLSLGAGLDGLLDAETRRAAPLVLGAAVPPLRLAAATAAMATPIAGTVSARVAARGTLSAPDVRVDVEGTGLSIEGRALGDAAATLRHGASTSTAEVTLRPAGGGTLSARGSLDAPRGFADPAALGRASANLRVVGDRVDLGFLSVVAPWLIRRSAGSLSVDLSAAGPLATLRPRGTVRLENGRLDVASLGDWTGVTLVAALGERDLEISRLEARRARGSLSGHLAVRDVGAPQARLEGRLELQQLEVTRAGEVLAVLELPLDLEGTAAERGLDATLTLGAGTIRLPRKKAGSLQPVVERSDIIDADAVAERARRRERVRLRLGAGERAYELRCRVVTRGKLFVRSERPAANLEVAGDTTWSLGGAAPSATGELAVVRGTFEPVAGRVFHVERARVAFPGGAVDRAQLDVVARYDNPVAVVTVTVTGPVTGPAIRMSSRPPLDDASIAMLVATGRTEMNLNTGGVGPLTAREAGLAMVSAAVNTVFTGLVADKLPVDQISLDSSRVRAGKYLTDRLFVGWAYRFDAKPEEGENANEVTAEYQIAPGWKLEVRYGDAPAGDASVLWSRDY